MTAPPAKPALVRSPARLFLILAAAIFVAEVIVMLLLSALPAMAPMLTNLLDATILIVLIFPVLRAFAFVPLVGHLRAREAAEAQLQEANRILEQRVQERAVALQTEVGEHMRATEELQWKSAFLEAQVNSSIDGILVVDQAGMQSLQNRRFVDLFKIPPHIADEKTDATRLKWVTDMAKNPEQFIKKVLHLYAHPNEISRDEIELKDGTILDRYSSPVVGKDGKYYGRIWTFRDITERRQADEMLRQSENRFRSLVEESPDVIGIYQERKLVFINSTGTRLFGARAKEELLSRRSEQMIHPDDLTDSTERIRRRLAGETGVYPAEVRYLRLDGTTVPMEVSAAPITFAGQPAVQFIARDISERKRTMETLAQERSLLRTVVDALPDFIYVKDCESRFRLSNLANARLLGLDSPEQLVGKTDFDFFPPELAAEYLVTEQTVVKTGQPLLDVEERLFDPTGALRWQLTTQVPLRDSQGKVIGLVGLGRDITERKRAGEALRESEERFSSAFEYAPIGVALLSPEGRWLKVNRALCELTGYSEAELLTRTFQDITHPEDLEGDLENVRRMLAGEIATYQIEKRYVHGRGHLVTVLLNVSMVRDGQGQPRYFISQIQDITERKKMENALRESDEKFHQLADNITDAFWIRSPDLREVHYVSPAFERIWGRSVASLYSNPEQWADCIFPADRARVLAAFAALTGDTPTLDLEYRIVRPDGDVRWVHVRGFQVRDSEKKLIRHIGIVTDITERKKAEDTLRRTEELYRRAIASAGAVPYASDFKSKSYLFMGEGIEQLTGYPIHEVTSQFWKTIIEESVMLGETAGLTQEEAARRMRSGEIRNWRCDMRIRTRDGKSRWLSDASVQNLDESGLIIGSMGILQDITERKQAEIFTLAFSKMSKDLSSAVSAEEAARIISEVSDELLGWDASCVQLYSEKDDVIHSIFNADIIHGIRSVSEPIKSRKPTEMNRRVLTSGAQLILRDQPMSAPFGTIGFGDHSRPSASLMFVPIRYRTRTIGILSIQSYTPKAYGAEDLTTLQTLADQCGGALERIWADEALRNAQVQLFQSQKMETVGKLAGGFAHEFNSILTVIIGQSELMREDLPAGDPLIKNATEISKAAERAAGLTRQLLAYGRKQFLQPETLDLNEVIARMEAMFQHLLGGDVDTRIVPAPGLLAVKADAGQIELVIINMVMNAAAAMPKGGKLTLETANVVLDENSSSRYPELKPGHYAMLAITDTGTGMSDEVKARAFDPFFTTKDVGQGTGLGLSTCYGIVKQSGGHISVYSERDRGTTFKIYLPQVQTQTKIPPPRGDSPELPRGTETILLAEDDPALREMAASLLKRLGYTVLAAANGVEALALSEERGSQHIDLLFTDFVMPNMSGKELAELMAASSPNTRILFASAYTENAIVHQGVLDKGVALLQKPFTPSALALKIREVLDR